MRVITYHRVGPWLPGVGSHYGVSPARFRRHMGLARRLGRFCDLEAALHFAQHGGGVERRIALTFDDGFAEVAEHAAPLLLEKGIPATIFVVTDKEKADWTNWGETPVPRLLTRREVQELAQAGITIGSHGRTHVRLAHCGPAQLREEVRGSKAVLEDWLGREVRHFCYPYGSYNEKVTAAVREAGYASGWTARKSNVRPGTDPFELPRWMIGRNTGMVRLARRLLLSR